MNKEDIVQLLIDNPNGITIDMIYSLNNDELNEFIELTKTLEKQNHFEQTAKKKQINSLSGALANEYFPLFDIRLSKSITSYGRLYVKSIGQRVNDYLINNYDYSNINNNALIYSHTDSAYFTLKPLYDKFINDYTINNKDYVDLLLDKGNELLKITDGQFKYCSIICNSKNPNVLKMAFENIADKGIFCKAANYFIRSNYNKTKLTKPKMKIVGMSIIKSSTPSFSKQILQKALDIFLDGSELEIIEFIEKNYKEFKNQNLEDISFNKSIGDINKCIVDNEYKLNILNEINQIKIYLGKEFNINYDELLDESHNENFNASKQKLLLYNYLLNIDLEISLGLINLNNIIDYKFQIENLLSEYYNNKYINYLNEKFIKIIKMINHFNNKIYNNILLYDNKTTIIKKGTSSHIYGSIIYNQYVEFNNLNLEYIHSKDKIKYIYLKPNNPFNSNVIAYKDSSFFNLVELKEFVDYDLQFEKAFINPLLQITKALDININKNKKNSYLNTKLIKFESLFK